MIYYGLFTSVLGAVAPYFRNCLPAELHDIESLAIYLKCKLKSYFFWHALNVSIG